MAAWEEERRKVWGLLLDLKRKIKELEREKHRWEQGAEQPAKQAGA